MAVLGRRNNDFTVNADSDALQPQLHGKPLHHCPPAKHKSPVGAAAGCDLLTLIFFKQKQDQKIAAFGSSYKDWGQFRVFRVGNYCQSNNSGNLADTPIAPGAASVWNFTS
ncbi:hypothetical protein [Pseudomonas koreensis]|uniref:hypothetical protein n=1 Tax=Pseudomonas koreensis TaxID=198620 RepID=UPI00380FD33F